jgi:hypothetical protein
MTARSSFAASRRRPEARFIAQLARADGALRELHARAASICESGNLEILGFRREQLDSLSALLSHGYQLVDGRITALDGGRPPEPRVQETNAFSRNAIVEPITFLASYRSCCRILCAAMREAMGLHDQASALLLRDLILRLEKQLWVIDTPARNRGLDDNRAVALFLTC